MTSKSHTNLLLLMVVGGIMSACQKDLLLSTPQTSLLTKVILTQYLPNYQGMYASSHPPIIVQGTPYKYCFQLEQVYQYDILNRLTLDKQTNVDTPDNHGLGGNESSWYRYVENKVIHNRSIAAGDDTLTLNEWGYAIPNYFLRINTTYTYDENGYLLRKQTPNQIMLQTVGTGNLTKQVIQTTIGTWATEHDTTEYEYDVAHLALPNPFALFSEGKGSRNLLIKSTTRFVRNDTLIYTSFYKPYSVSTSYSYEFDQQNRVKKQTSFTTNTNEGYTPILTVKDFVYSN